MQLFVALSLVFALGQYPPTAAEPGTGHRIRTRRQVQCSTACEKDGPLLTGQPVGQVDLACSHNQKISIISALYGRLDNLTCPTVTINIPEYSTTCSAVTAPAKVGVLCNGKESCSVKANNQVFGDPCIKTQKYLTVCYRCESTGLFTAHNINVADKCCFILRSPRDATYILTDPFSEACSGGCAYKPHGSYGKSVCLENIRIPTCCSYSTGALCQLYGNLQNGKNIAEKGTCSNKCQEIANYSKEPSNNWFKNERIPQSSRRSLSLDIFQRNASGPEPVEQSAQVYPLALKSERFKRSGGDCSWIFAWIFTCYNADCYCQFMTSVDWYSINENEHYFKHECCSVFQPLCPGLPSCPST